MEYRNQSKTKRRWALGWAGALVGVVLLWPGGEDRSKQSDHPPEVARGGSHGTSGAMSVSPRAHQLARITGKQIWRQARHEEPAPGENRAPGEVDIETLVVGNHPVEVARGEMLVRFKPTVNAANRARIWRITDVEVLQISSHFDVYRVRAPEGVPLDHAMALMTHLPEVESVGPNAIAYGSKKKVVEATDEAEATGEAQTKKEAKNEAKAQTLLQAIDEQLLAGMVEAPDFSRADAIRYSSMQWYAKGLSQLQYDGWPSAWALVPEATGVTVAILDSGVAYDAPSLACTDFAEGYDFVNADADPTDDHQHGTHLTSLLTADPECGALIRGYSVGARVMPVKVLGASLSGTEFQVAEGLFFAADNGADVINMSLSFGYGYQPGVLLQRALRAGSTSGAVMAAAAGNAGVAEVAWPAASPHVIAVGAYERPTLWNKNNTIPDGAVYSNQGAALDILAPGGNLTMDHEGDGIPDGVVAEAFDPATPGSFGYWVAAGTSQATVGVTGLAALMLKQGVNARLVQPIISATGDRQGDGFHPSYGNGVLRPAFALTYHLHQDYPGDLAMLRRYQVSPVAMEVTSEDGTERKIAVAVGVRESSDEASSHGVAREVTVFGHWGGATIGSASCTVRVGDDHCIVRSPALSTEDGYLASFFVDRVQEESANQLYRWAAPAVGYYGLSQLEASAVIAAEGHVGGVIFALRPDSELAQHLFGDAAELTFNVRNLGPASVLPAGVAVLNQDMFTQEEDEAEADGNGLGSSSLDFGGLLPGMDAFNYQVMWYSYGNGLGSSSLVLDLAWPMMYDTTQATMYSFGNGLGSSSIPSDYSSLLLNGYDGLSVMSSSWSWMAIGNGLGSSSLVFDSYTYLNYSTQSMSMMPAPTSLGMSLGEDGAGAQGLSAGMVPLER